MELLDYLRHPELLAGMIILVSFMIVFGGKETKESSWKEKFLVGLAVSGLLGLIWLGSSIFKGFIN